MVTVSLCMIVKNEAAHLPRCLRSVHGLADEILIADTGSTDGTKEIAAAFGARLFDFPWCDDFAAARNFIFSKAAMDYCLWLDADDVLLQEDRQAFLDLKAHLDSAVDVVMMQYHTAFDADGQPVFTYRRERLLRRAAGFRWEGRVHEAIRPRGKILQSDIAVTHRKTGPGDPDRNLRIYEAQRMAGEPFSPRAEFYYARELMAHRRYADAAAAFRTFLKNPKGWNENKRQACRDLAACETALGRPEEAFAALTHALRFGVPGAELCCDLGRFFFDRAAWKTAAFWYKAALRAPENDAGGFTQPGCRDVIPCLQLCVCHFRLGDRAAAEKYNDRVGALRPEHPAYLYNKAWFENHPA